jgi:hypothetical protein
MTNERFDVHKLDEVVLALLHFNADRDGRAWKSFDWDVLDRLFERGLITNPKSKARSVVLTEEGTRLAEGMFEKHFGVAG